MLRIIYYDIESDKIRTKVAETLLKYGYYRLQYSVFCGTHTSLQFCACRGEIEELMIDADHTKDSIYFLPIGEKTFRDMDIIGKPPDFDTLLDSHSTLFI